MEKLNNLKALISLNEELYISKEAKKENALTSVGKSYRPEKINMRVTTSQYEIHNCPVKTEGRKLDNSLGYYVTFVK